MVKKMLIDATHSEETRVVVVDGNKVEEFDFESENRRQLAGNIYLAKVTRVEPSLQAAFIEYGGNRHGFLAFSEIHPDYYQIPVADRETLIAEERAYADAQRALENDEEEQKKTKSSKSVLNKAQSSKQKDAIETKPVETSGISGMETIDFESNHKFENAIASTDLEDNSAKALEDDMSNAAKAEKDKPTHLSIHKSSIIDSAKQIDAVQEVDEFKTSDQSSNKITQNSDLDSKQESDILDGKSKTQSNDASAKDESIEDLAEVEDDYDLRSGRKPRQRRYKIQEVVKMRQILLIQVVKEERGNKGAALTTYLSLAGRYCVLMPNTARGGGISRKITNAVDRKKLKEIANSIDVPQGAGLIIRTAGAKRTKTEVKRDYEYLQRLWEQIRELTLKSIAPVKIYEEGDLIKRSIRDLYNREIDEVLVEGDRGYRIAKDFMKMIMPSHAKNVQIYNDTMPLFARYQVESCLLSMFNPIVQLKSGGYIVIGVTEALVAVDVNSGRATKEGSIEDTALKTNLEAAEEVARQLRLRDLAGLIVIDFIDMDERKNNSAVEKRMKDRLKTDRARIQVGRISGFGLMEMSRQRLRPGMLEATTQGCPHCHGTGLIRSEDNIALAILRQIEDEGSRRRSREVLVRCPVSVANFLMNQKRDHITQIEARHALSVRVEGVMTFVSPEYEIEKFKEATRSIVQSVETLALEDTQMIKHGSKVDEGSGVDEQVSDIELDEVEEENKPKKRRRRRRRRKSSGLSSVVDVSEENNLIKDVSGEGSALEATGSQVEIKIASSAFVIKQLPDTQENSKDDFEDSIKKPVKRQRQRSLQKDGLDTNRKNVINIKEQNASKNNPEDNEIPKIQRKSIKIDTNEAKSSTAIEKPKRKVASRKRKVEPDAAADTISDNMSTDVNKLSKPKVKKPSVAKKTDRSKRKDLVSESSEGSLKVNTDNVKKVEASHPMQTDNESNAATDAEKPRRQGWWSSSKNKTNGS